LVGIEKAETHLLSRQTMHSVYFSLFVLRRKREEFCGTAGFMGMISPDFVLTVSYSIPEKNMVVGSDRMKG
jgi:hypothetical protein